MPKKGKKMREWKKLFFSGLMNARVGLWIAGIIRLVLEGKDVISSVVVIVCATYAFICLVILSKNTEEKED